MNGVLNEEGAFDACVTVAYDPAVCMQLAAVKPELRLERLVESEYAFICDDIRILYRVTNEGTGETAAVTVREELPDGFQTVEGERQVQLELPPIAAGETAEEIVVVRAQREGELRGRATASSDMAEVRSNESVVRVFEPALELRVNAQEQQYVGRPVNIHLVVTNTSTAPVTQTEISWQPPEQLEFVSADGDSRVTNEGQQLQFAPIPELPPGEVATWRVIARAREVGKVRLRAELMTDATEEAVFEIEPTTIY